jgi:tight adherence protein C
MTLMISAAVFAIVNAIVLLTFYVMTAESPLAARLRGLTTQGQIAAQMDERRKAKGGSTFIRQAIQTLGSYGVGQTDRSLGKQLSAAGFRSPTALPLFLGMRTLFSFGPALLLLVPRIMAGEPLGESLYWGVGAWLFGHFGANYWLKAQSGKRTMAITHALPDSLDLLVVCLEAGIGLNAALARVGDERADFKDPLGMELRQVAAEMRGGRPREEALHDLGDRNGVEDLKSLTALVIQSHRLGASMAKTLRSHADLLRTKRRQRAEEAARKLPIKVLIPLATFLLPPLFVVVVGPAFLKFGDLVQFLTNR